MMKKGIFMFLPIYKITLRNGAPTHKFKNENKAILTILVALSSECTGVYHALGNRLWALRNASGTATYLARRG